MSRKERVRQINIENNKNRLVEQWADRASKAGEDDYVSKLLKQQEEGGLQNKGKERTVEPNRKDRVRQINIATMQSELYSKDKKHDSALQPQLGFKPSFTKFVRIYFGVFVFVVIFGFAIYITG